MLSMRLITILCLCSLAAGSVLGQAWLDEPLSNWNKPGTAIPKPRQSVNSENPSHCKEVERSPTTPADRAVAAAGWSLYGLEQTYGKTVVVWARSGWDGMCRPLGYQAFAFSGGQFAGTVSPEPMDSRTDGAVSRVRIANETTLVGGFLRYTTSDALCCPSRTTRVTFKIVNSPEGAVLVPESIQTARATPF